MLFAGTVVCSWFGPRLFTLPLSNRNWDKNGKTCSVPLLWPPLVVECLSWSLQLCPPPSMHRRSCGKASVVSRRSLSAVKLGENTSEVMGVMFRGDISVVRNPAWAFSTVAPFDQASENEEKKISISCQQKGGSTFFFTAVIFEALEERLCLECMGALHCVFS